MSARGRGKGRGRRLVGAILTGLGNHLHELELCAPVYAVGCALTAARAACAWHGIMSVYCAEPFVSSTSHPTLTMDLP